MLDRSTIVFDLDGTLVDTAPDLTNALNGVLTRRGHAPVSAETMRFCVGHGARVMIEEALRRIGADGDVERMLAEFLAHYEANIAAESRPYPGVVAALEALAETGATLAVCTNKRERLSRLLLQELDLMRFFTGLAGRDTFPFSKPNPAHLFGAIELAGGPRTAIMVGDSEVDYLTAKAAHIPIVMVRFGYGPLPNDGAGPDALVDHFDELLPHLHALARRPLAPSSPS